MKLDPLLLIPAILDLVKRVFEQINNLGVCFFFFLVTASQSITDELRDTERLDQRHKHTGVTRLDHMKHGSGIKDRDDRSSGIKIPIADVLVKINPTDPLILGKQAARRNLNCSDSSGIMSLIRQSRGFTAGVQKQ